MKICPICLHDWNKKREGVPLATAELYDDEVDLAAEMDAGAVCTEIFEDGAYLECLNCGFSITAPNEQALDLAFATLRDHYQEVAG